MIDISKLEWAKKRFEYKEHKLTLPKAEATGRVSFKLLLTEEAMTEAPPPAATDSPNAEKEKERERKEKEKRDKKERHDREKEAKALEKKDNHDMKKRLKEEQKTLRLSKSIPTEEHLIETKAGIGTITVTACFQILSEFLFQLRRRTSYGI